MATTSFAVNTVWWEAYSSFTAIAYESMFSNCGYVVENCFIKTAIVELLGTSTSNDEAPNKSVVIPKSKTCIFIWYKDKVSFRTNSN